MCVFFPLRPIQFDSASPVYSDIECGYMKLLMEKIVTSETHSITMMAALHLCGEAKPQNAPTQSTSKKITKQRAEDLVDDWMAAGYFFLMNDDTAITLGPKALAEFRDTLRTKFPDDIQNCHLCSEITMKVRLIRLYEQFLFGSIPFYFSVAHVVANDMSK